MVVKTVDAIQSQLSSLGFKIVFFDAYLAQQSSTIEDSILSFDIQS